MITLAKANKELKKVVDYIEENASAWNEQRSLKLYDVAYYDCKKDFPLTFKRYRDGDFDKFFNEFCEQEYTYFLEWLGEKNIDENILNYIGRTSSFYIGNYSDKTINYGIENILSDCYYFNYIQFNENLQILPYGEFILEDDEVQEELNYIVGDLFDDVKEILEPIIKVANYIDDFKANQLECFKEYLSYEENNLQAEKENRDIEIEANNKKVSIFINKVKSIITVDELNMIKKLYIKEEV